MAKKHKNVQKVINDVEPKGEVIVVKQEGIIDRAFGWCKAHWKGIALTGLAVGGSVLAKNLFFGDDDEDEDDDDTIEDPDFE